MGDVGPPGDSRELLVLRHAKASRGGHESDFDRPLTKRGRRDAPRMARWIKARDLLPDCIVSSPARRARETAELVVEELELAKDAIRWEPRVYEASARDLMTVLLDCPAAARRVLLVGHNPGLEDLVHRLAGGSVREPEEGKFLPTGALARLRVAVPWNELRAGAAELVDLARPRFLDDDADG
jgi:phosphohistidine phosphatase